MSTKDIAQNRVRKLLRLEVVDVLTRVSNRERVWWYKQISLRMFTAAASFVVVALLLGTSPTRAQDSQSTQDVKIQQLAQDESSNRAQIDELRQSLAVTREETATMRGITIGAVGIIGILQSVQMLGIGLRKIKQ